MASPGRTLRTGAGLSGIGLWACESRGWGCPWAELPLEEEGAVVGLAAPHSAAWRVYQAEWAFSTYQSAPYGHGEAWP